MQLLQKVLFTPEGKEELALEIACLEQVRRDILNDAESMVNGNNRSARFELVAVDLQISRLKEVLSKGAVTDQTGLVVAVGSEVTVTSEDGEETFTIGGPLAASPRTRCISYESPLAQALLGRELGETVEVSTVGCVSRLKIVAIRRGRPGSGGC
ncbi:MAG: GreA/GreB family elongation factor [Chloroflexota bacterium]|jgi:transcription elongation factor GreA